MMKRPVYCLLWFLAILGTGCVRKEAAAAGPAAIKIGVSVPQGGKGWIGALSRWALQEAEAAETAGDGALDLQVLTAADILSQIRQVEDLTLWGMRYLVIFPGEPEILTPIIKTVYARGIQVVVVEQPLTDSSFGYIHLRGDYSEMGRLSGLWLAQEMKAAGLTNYAVLGNFPDPADRERASAFFAEMNREISLVNLPGSHRYGYARGSPQQGRRLVQAYFRQYPKIDALYCQDDEILPGVLEAVRDARRRDVKFIFGGGGSRAVLRMIINNDSPVRATALYYPPLIREGIRYTAEAAKTGTFPQSRTPVPVVIPPTLIDIFNAEAYYEADSPY
ncbi:MAG: substrate-binding domain-containing protein [Treponema sp.]|jgi:ribose transport system substrate-binding protein|nr:substrate-binding domain-containing protein [Treponema sp.]